MTMIRFDSSDWMLDSMEFCAPFPIETIAITEPMPMMMPSMVSPVRTLFTKSAEYVSSKISARIIQCVRDQHSIADCYGAVGILRDARIVGNKHHGSMLLFIQCSECIENHVACFGIKIARR